MGRSGPLHLPLHAPRVPHPRMVHCHLRARHLPSESVYRISHTKNRSGLGSGWLVEHIRLSSQSNLLICVFYFCCSRWWWSWAAYALQRGVPAVHPTPARVQVLACDHAEHPDSHYLHVLRYVQHSGVLAHFGYVFYYTVLHNNEATD